MCSFGSKFVVVSWSTCDEPENIPSPTVATPAAVTETSPLTVLNIERE